MNKIAKIFVFTVLLSVLVSSIAYAYSYEQQTENANQTIIDVPYFYVDNNTSDVDANTDKGTHSNFPAQKQSPDSTYDLLTESDTNGLSLDATGGHMIVGDGSVDWGSTAGTISFWVKMDSVVQGRFWGQNGNMETRWAGSNLVLDWGSDTTMTSATSFSADTWYFIAIVWDETSNDLFLFIGDTTNPPTADANSLNGTWTDTTPVVTENRFLNGHGANQPVDGHGDDLRYWDTSRTSAELQGDYNVELAGSETNLRSYFKLSSDFTDIGPDSNDGSGSGSYSFSTDVPFSQASSYMLDLEVQWTNVVDYSETNEELCIYLSDYSQGSLDATGGYMIVGDGSVDWGSAAGTISFWVKMDSVVQGRFWGQNGNMETRWAGSNLVLDWGGTSSMTSATSFSADTWYFVAIVWDENNNDLLLYVGDETSPPTLDANSLNGVWWSTTPSPTENRFLNGLGGNQPVDGHGDDLRYYDIARSPAEIQSDYNVTITGSETNLRSYFRLNNNFDDAGPDNNDGSGYGSYSYSSDTSFNVPATESLRVDVWTGSVWQNVFAQLTNGWNNASISAYLTSSTLTVRFKGNSETIDSAQNSWNIDSSVIHAWT